MHAIHAFSYATILSAEQDDTHATSDRELVVHRFQVRNQLTEDCTSFEQGVSNVKSQGASWKATVTTRLDSHDDVKILCGTIKWGSETFKETDHVKTNYQQ